jgi:hypothetical protein
MRQLSFDSLKPLRRKTPVLEMPLCSRLRHSLYCGEGRACNGDLLRLDCIRVKYLRPRQEASDESCMSYLQESELSKAAFEACHSRTTASLTQCGDHACKKRSSAFCSGCQIAYCKYMGAQCWSKAHTVLYFEFLKEAKATALKKFKEKKKSK